MQRNEEKKTSEKDFPYTVGDFP